jgi:porin
VAEAAVTPYANEEGIATRFRLGGWYHTSHHFADQHFATDGLSLANPASTGVPRSDVGDRALYGTAETMLYRAPGTKDQGLAVFARVAGLPTAQNEVSLYGDGGITYKGLVPSRPDDTAGIAFAYLGVSSAARALDFDTRHFSGNPDYPVRDHEILVEATYQAKVAPWWKLQSVLQHWFHPGGKVLNADGRLRQGATVIGLRMQLLF